MLFFYATSSQICIQIVKLLCLLNFLEKTESPQPTDLKHLDCYVSYAILLWTTYRDCEQVYARQKKWPEPQNRPPLNLALNRVRGPKNTLKTLFWSLVSLSRKHFWALLANTTNLINFFGTKSKRRGSALEARQTRFIGTHALSHSDWRKGTKADDVCDILRSANLITALDIHNFKQRL